MNRTIEAYIKLYLESANWSQPNNKGFIHSPVVFSEIYDIQMAPLLSQEGVYWYDLVTAPDIPIPWNYGKIYWLFLLLNWLLSCNYGNNRDNGII